MQKAFLLATAVSLVLPIGASAQVAEPTTPEASLELLLSEMPDANLVTRITHQPMDAGYLKEALVEFGDECDATDGCRWLAFSEYKDGWRAIGEGRAHQVSFSEVDGGHQINADGMRWDFKGGDEITLAPGLLAGKAPMPADPRFLQLLAEKTQYKLTDQIRLEKYAVDINNDGADEILLMIGGSYYAAGSWGTPYVIFDATDQPVLSSITSDLPKIFPWGAGAIVVDAVPAGLVVHEIE